MRSWVSHQGFTLLELLITLSVITVLLTTAAPSFTSTLEHYKLRRLVNQLATNLHLARTEAVRTNQTIYVHNVNMSSSTNSGWCVVMTSNAATPGGCSASDWTQALAVVDGGRFPSIFISGNRNYSSFDGARSIASQAMSYTLITSGMRNEQEVKVNVSTKSRISRCSKDGALGFESC
ncbi:GspH/FimT family pseudopilin [Photobacterium alginatilyticum]|uniref:GspH/FimT family pseudopilin n=1 Tax=Photobacterium alginatilyticum TaxID=1775171 RepID=UPI004068BC37